MFNFNEVGASAAKTVANSGVFKNFVKNKLGYSYNNQFAGDTYVRDNVIQLVAEWGLEIDPDEFEGYILSSDVSGVEQALRNDDEAAALSEADAVYDEAWQSYLDENSDKLGVLNSEIDHKFEDMLDNMLISLEFAYKHVHFAFNELYDNYSYDFDTRVYFESNDFPSYKNEWIVRVVERNMSKDVEM